MVGLIPFRQRGFFDERKHRLAVYAIAVQLNAPGLGS